MGRRAVAVACMAGLLGGCAAPATQGDASGLPTTTAEGPAPARRAPTDHARLDDHAEAVGDLLESVAAAFRAGDAYALRPWLHDPDSAFGKRWLDRAAAMRGVPLTSYTLQLDTSGADLTAPDVPGGDGLLVNVIEEHQLEGMAELGPAREHLFLTLRPGDGGRWTVAGDTDGERLGLVSVDHLWDHGPVVATRRGDLLALHHPAQESIEAVLAEAEAALATTRERWPLAWPERVPLLVPADQDELAELLHVTFDLDNFIAFATATPIAELGDVTMSGSRVLLNTERFLSRSSETRERILVHELVHAASRPASSPEVPSWLEEGVAQALGERRSTTGTSLLDALVDGDWAGALPLDAEFSAGDRDSTFLSYQRSWSFVDWLVRQHGEDRVGAFYLAVGRESAGLPGTTAAKLDAAAIASFGAPLADLVAAWRDSL